MAEDGQSEVSIEVIHVALNSIIPTRRRRVLKNTGGTEDSG